MSPCAGSGMINVADGLLYPALRKANITLGPGRTPSDAQFQDCLDELNRLTGSLNCDRLFIYALDKLSLSVTVNGPESSWTIGNSTSADFQQQRPQGISSASLNASGGVSTPLLVATPQQWVEGNNSSCGCDLNPSSMLYFDGGYPVATIYLQSYVTGPQTLELWVWHLVPRFTSVSNAVALPLGYEDALVLNLAVRLGPHFQRATDPALRADARESLMRLESINAPRPIAVLSDIGGCC